MPTINESEREMSVNALFNVDVLVVMRWASEAWSQVSSTSISHCWRHTQVLDEDMYELVDSIEKLRVTPPTMRDLLN